MHGRFTALIGLILTLVAVVGCRPETEDVALPPSRQESSVTQAPAEAGAVAVAQAEPATDAAPAMLVNNTDRLQEALASPYGVSAHISGREHPQAPRSTIAMRNAGLGWVRTDFWRSEIQTAPGVWDYSRMDRTVEYAHNAGLQVLPILDYDVPWAKPAHEHLDEWLEYVNRTVTRYKDRISHWEVWNEPNHALFWPDPADPTGYVKLLQATYPAIKAIDPDATVLLAGLSHVPFHWLEPFYEAGGGDFFDVMNVHPYRFPAPPEAGRLYEDLIQLRQLMAKYGDGDKPIWVTEIGWPTHRSPLLEEGGLLVQIVRAGLRTLDPQRQNWTIGVLDPPPDYPLGYRFPEPLVKQMAPGQAMVRNVGFADLAGLDPSQVHALLMPVDEAFPADVFDAMEDYVRRGGNIVFIEGVPLYYTMQKRSDGSGWERKDAPEAFRRRLRIGWEAHWKRAGVPQSTKSLAVPPALADQIRLPEHPVPASRFFTDAALQSGDRMIPLITVDSDTYRGAVAAVYDLDSDLTGGVIVSSFFARPGIAEEELGRLVPRVYLTCFQAGVEKVFWYEFESNRDNPYSMNAHYGLTGPEHHATPAYVALQTLTRLRPAGSQAVKVEYRNGAVFQAAWVRPDGQHVWALWKPGPAGEAEIAFEGQIQRARDHLGRDVAVSATDDGAATVRLSDSVLYLEGPTAVRVGP